MLGLVTAYEKTNESSISRLGGRSRPIGLIGRNKLPSRSHVRSCPRPNAVIAALSDLGPRAIPAMPRLIKLLDTREHELSRETRAVLMRALPQIDLEGLQCLPALIRTVETRTGTERAWAVFALGQIGPPARASVPSLIRTFMAESENDSDERTSEILGPTATALRTIA
jgi:hypothetical protein